MDCNRCSPRYLWGGAKMHVIFARDGDVRHLFIIGARMRMFILTSSSAPFAGNGLHRQVAQW